MRSRFTFVLALITLMSVGINCFADPKTDTDAKTAALLKELNNYQVGPGDELKIDVYGEPDLSISTKLSDTGSISYPLLGDLKVQGKTAIQIGEIITNRLKEGYIVNPSVSVNVITYRQFFINGEVKNPDGYAYQPGLTLRKAIALAGGVTERASSSKITVIHENDTDKKPKSISLDDVLRPGDIITVPQSFF